ncbi:Hypothetical predicted protein [Mytilus galloprovincialis]|uniref:Uncharacterized protein n=1 Tax=Mytilus galloprovincialis TaxID=29158 RepID=A0A8B6EKK1_MYTGA|nr:Hypothetical predicted protein [Mytilus galloprovincialis]
MAVAFRPGSDKKVEMGFSVLSSEVTPEDAQVMLSALIETIPTSEVGNMLELNNFEVPSGDGREQYGLPGNVQFKECSYVDVKFKLVEDTKEYVSKRLRHLSIHVDGVINFEAFNIDFRSGYNKGSSKIQTFSVEQRIQHVSVQEPFQLNKEFITDIKHLSSNYNLKDERSVLRWKAFFDQW